MVVRISGLIMRSVQCNIWNLFCVALSVKPSEVKSDNAVIYLRGLWLYHQPACISFFIWFGEKTNQALFPKINKLWLVGLMASW